MRVTGHMLLGLAIAMLAFGPAAHADVAAAPAPDGAAIAAPISATDGTATASPARPKPAAKKHVAKKSPSPDKSSGEVGLASWYGDTRQGQRTASGEHLDNGAFTAAHKTLPLHSRVRVTNLANGRSVTVRITDRGPRKPGRIIDLSQSAAAELGMMHKGLARVRVEPLSSHLINTAG